MKCPVCNENLVMSERQGVEIDYCPQCRGVWLDRGELDKILEKSVSYSDPHQSPAYQQPQRPPLQQSHYKDQHPHDYDHKNYNHDKDYNPNQQHHKKKESWLGDIFDF